VTVKVGPFEDPTSFEVEYAGDKPPTMVPAFDAGDMFYDMMMPLRKNTIRVQVRPKKPGAYRFVFYNADGHCVTTVQSQGDVPPNPNPGPNPNPNPNPNPPAPPDGALGLIKVSRDGVAAVALAADAKATQAAALGKSARSLASAVAAGGYASMAQVMAGWRDGNNAAVPGGSAAWAPWGAAVSAAVEKLYRDGKMADKAAWAAAFYEIATGLDGKTAN
jgi:hypothetical protein